MSRWKALTTVIVLVIALALRLYHLDFRALWWDEGLSLFFARLGLSEQARFAVLLADTNPPVYRLLLGLWTDLVGSSAWATRLFSALPGVVLVALAYRLTADLGRQKAVRRPTLPAPRSPLHVPSSAALVAAALTATSPMLVYYAQEAKGYSLVATSAAAAVLLWWRLLPAAGRSPKPWLWLAWGGCLLLALGSHYIFGFLLLLLNVWSFWRVRDFPRAEAARFIAWLLGVQVVVALILLPFVIATYGGTAAAVRGETGEFSGLHGPNAFFGQHLTEFALGPAGAIVPGLALAALLVVAGGIGACRARSRGVIMASLIAGPLLMGFVLNSYHEFFFPRFLLYTVPLLLALAALGLAQLARYWRPAAGTGLAVLALAFAPALAAHYAARGDPAEDWRPLAAAVQPHVRAGDGAIYVWGWIPGYLHAYLPPAPQPEYTLGYFTPDTLAPQMSSLVARHNRIWLFDYQVDTFDERNAAGRWLGERGGLAFAQWFGYAHVSLFALPDQDADGAACEMATSRFENGLALSFCRFTLAAHPGDSLAVPLTWQPMRLPLERLTVYVHVLGPDGAWITGRDSEPWNGLRPFTDRNAAVALRDVHAVLLPPDLPPGIYTLRAGLYDPATNQRARLDDGADGVTLGTVHVN